ncbi:MAG: hypothetical protein KDB58_10155 [Solirubrobacterales bacterium]|nr:hypothetical protein [Solirubrobacterales bacterium]MCB8969928.1 hypothetical protein [Thermoleophilales bacterium]MCO5328075.1 hypothetical protein [Solirubrobacterales bacterium]
MASEVDKRFERVARRAFAEYVANLTQELAMILQAVSRDVSHREFFPSVVNVRVAGEDPDFVIEVDLEEASGATRTRKFYIARDPDFRDGSGALVDGPEMAQRIAALARGLAY